RSGIIRQARRKPGHHLRPDSGRRGAHQAACPRGPFNGSGSAPTRVLCRRPVCGADQWREETEDGLVFKQAFDPTPGLVWMLRGDVVDYLTRAEDSRLAVNDFASGIEAWAFYSSRLVS